MHIAGTNGKGSVSHAGRGASGLRPHGGPVHFPAPGGPTERIRINGEWISRDFIAFVADHMAVWEELSFS